MVARGLLSIVFSLLLTLSASSHGADPWVRAGPDGQPQVQLYFFWALTCPHCTAAHPYIEAIPQARPWVRLHALELSRQPENVARYEAMARQLGEEAASVPAFIFCGEMVVGWESDATTGAYLRARLDACRARIEASGAVTPASPSLQTPASPPDQTPSALRLPLIGELDPASLSLPALTLVLAGLDAFNPCAFFVLLFLLSLLAHLHDRTRMLVIGGLFVLVSGGCISPSWPPGSMSSCSSATSPG